MRILTLLAGAAAGYVLGTRAGRESYDRLVEQVRKVWPGMPGQAPARQSPAAQVDTVSDPAHSDEVGHDWSDEGGATPSGPAAVS